MPKAKNTKICCIFNLAPHYRSAIYSRMDKELGCDFYFGDQVETPIKLMDVSCLSGYKKTVRNLKILHNNYIWQRGVIGLVFKNYKFYIITGDHKILSSLIIVFLARTYYPYRLSVYHILSEEVLKNVFRDLRIYYY